MTTSHATHSLPETAVAALRAGRTVDAIRLVREAKGIGLKEAKDLVDAAMARDTSLRGSGRSPVLEALGDFLAGSYKFPLAAGMGAGGFSLWFIGEFVPNFGKQFDPGLSMLVALGMPMVLVSGGLMVWARRWRRRRAAQAAEATQAAVAPTPPARARFGGLPDPGVPNAKPAGAVLSAQAAAALDRADPIAAIKIVRAETGLGLAEAKAVVDAALAARKR